ncbi:MAG: CCA tRNA nucleotidyltransferase [Alphaproteobacteria bacterium]|nr:CCA tRNA nucleotidyltransferase [Alphaproteobacteria bacterium]
MRLDRQPWMTTPAVTAVFDALGPDLPDDSPVPVVRFVGGCVRNAIAGRPVADIDLTTVLTPNEVIARLEAAGLKAIPTGLDHGTVTAVADHQPFEITTLRRDVETYGRHATVAFTDDWAEDSNRRDITFNALLADRDGTVHDFHGGIDDLKAGRVRFIGPAEKRIAEDTLRLLRFFRFFAQFGKPPADDAALAACAAAAGHLAALSGERVAKEMLALLACDEPTEAIRLMRVHGVLAEVESHLELVDRLAGLVSVEGDALLAADPLRRLAALTSGGQVGALAVAQRFRLSNADRDRMALIADPARQPEAQTDAAAARRTAYRTGRDAFVDLVALRWAEAPGEEEKWQALIDAVAGWAVPDFPLRGRDGLDIGIAAGPRLGALLDAIESWWIETDFGPGRDECLAELKRRADKGPQTD